MDSQRLLERFDGWESLTRGLQAHAHRVALEPTYVPLLGEQRVRRGVIDDSRKPGLFERLLKGSSKTLQASSEAPEGLPAEGEGPGELVELQLMIPPDQAGSIVQGSSFIQSLSSCEHHVGYEILGAADGIIVQVVCDRRDVHVVRATLRSQAPGVRAVERADHLWGRWTANESFGVIVSFGLTERVFHKLRCAIKSEVDPLSEIVAQLDDLESDELALTQVLFEPARAPWREDLEEFVSHIDDVDKVLHSVKDKFSEPTFAVVIRAAALSFDADRVIERGSRLANAVRLVTTSDANELAILPPAAGSFEAEAHDLLERTTHRSGMLLALSELQTLVHLPSAAVRSDRLLRHTARSKAAPAAVRGSGVLIGVNEHEEAQHQVRLTDEHRLRHVHIIGASGSGKSTLLLNMAVEDIKGGRGVAVLDPHGDLVDEIIARLPEERIADVILFDPADEEYPIAFNVLSARSDQERTLLASDFVGAFRRLSSTTFGDQMVSVLGNAVLALLEAPGGGTLLDLRRFLIDKSFRSEILDQIDDETVKGYWLEEFPMIKGMPHSSILTRLNTFLRPKVLRYMVAQQNDRLDFRAIMDGRKIFLAKLTHGLIGEENAHLLGSLLVAKFAQAAMTRQDEAKVDRAAFNLLIDEFHHFVTPSVATILTSVRKYGLGLCLAHHELRQLKSRSEDVASAVLANAYTRIVFRTTGDDARTLASGFSYFEPRDIENLGIGHAIARVERADWDFNVRTAMPDDMTAEVRRARAIAVRDASRRLYATPRNEVEALLIKVAPSAPSSKQSTKPATEPKEAEPASAVLASVIETPGRPTPGRGGAQHKYLQSLIRKLAEDRGFDVTVERSVLDGHGYVDVVLKKAELSIACEISVTTRVAHELDNLSKCLAAGFSYAVLIALDPRMLEQARADFGTEHSDRVRFTTADDFIAFLDEFNTADTKQTTRKGKKGNQGQVTASTTAPGSESKRLLGTNEAAEYIGLAVQTLAKMRVTGDSPPFFKLGRQVMYDREDLDAWIAERRRRSTSDTGRPADRTTRNSK